MDILFFYSDLFSYLWYYIMCTVKFQTLKYACMAMHRVGHKLEKFFVSLHVAINVLATKSRVNNWPGLSTVLMRTEQ